MKPRYEKLIRDGIPALAASEGRALPLRTASPDEIEHLLAKKLFEETAEVAEALQAGDITWILEELADLSTVVDAIRNRLGISAAALQDAIDRKEKIRGGFNDGYLLALDAPPSRRLFPGQSDRFLHALRQDLARCTAAHFAVAFSMRSGLALIEGPLRSALLRGIDFRMLTTDYLGITEPEALTRLLELHGRADIRVFSDPAISFHPKAYIFEFPGGRGRAYIGSSNLSRSALLDGIEWNWTVLDGDAGFPLSELLDKFEEIFDDRRSVPLNANFIEAYAQRRHARLPTEGPQARQLPVPNPAQVLALSELERLRADSERRGLVIAATGIGKTYLAAFDSQPFRTVLFLAHRKELLTQAEATFRAVRPDARTGFAVDGRLDLDADILFASVQTLGRESVYQQFDRTRFSYVVVDEFHHAAAPSYRGLLDWFDAEFMLGLTATPYRSDNRDLLAICHGNIAYRATLFQAITFGWLVPFRYYGVADVVSYDESMLNASRTAYDEKRLTQAFNTQQRAQLALEHFGRHRRNAALGFCVSIEHADFMATWFSAHGVPARAVHSGPHSIDRVSAISELVNGRVGILFTVDLFNEGVDIPQVDLVMFLRPTESMTVFLQQLGRGLRLHAPKGYLTVVDLIGNYRRAHYKLPFLTNLDADNGDASADALRKLRAPEGLAELPEGVEIHIDEIALERLRESLERDEPIKARLLADFRDVAHRLNHRPSIVEYEHFARSSARQFIRCFGSWFRGLSAAGAIDDRDQILESECGEFIRDIEKTPMTKSFKMVVLAAMATHGGILHPIRLDALIAYFQQFFSKEQHYADVAGTPVSEVMHASHSAWERYLLDNPIKAWIGGNTGHTGYFAYDSTAETFTYRGPRPSDGRHFEQAVQDRVTFRLEDYFARRILGTNVYNVIPNGEGLCIMLGNAAADGMPRGEGWKLVKVGDEFWYAKFAKIAINVLKKVPDETRDTPNQLTKVLSSLLGDDNRPRRQMRVRITRAAEGDYWILDQV